MTELAELEWELAGLQVNAAPYGLASVDGLDDAANMDPQTTQLGGDGQTVTLLRLADRNVTLDIDIDAESAADRETRLAALRTAMAPPTDRVTPKVFRWRNPGEPTKRVTFTPAQGRSLEIAGTEASLIYFKVNAKAHLYCADPVIYSDTAVATTFTVTGSPVSHTIVNAGTLAAVSAGAYSLELVADGTVVNPVLTDGNGGRVALMRTLSDGQTWTIDTARGSYVGATWVGHQLRGSGGCPVAGWPILRPGNNTLTLSATSGDFVATLTHRSTW